MSLEIDLSPIRCIRSLGHRTSLAVLAYGNRLEEKKDYVVAESPANPTYYYGNLLIMKAAPVPGDFEKWTRAFKDEFKHQPLIRHMLFGWDATSGKATEVAEFTSRGFEFDLSVVLTLEASGLRKPKHVCEGLVVRPLQSDEEWEAAIQNQVACRDPQFELERYLKYKRAQMARYRHMAEKGLGHWFGAFLGGQLAGECGLYVFEGVGRYQMVGTSPDFRRRGVCGNLIYETARLAFEKLGAKNLVMVADPEYHAAKVYESVGFRATEDSLAMVKYPEHR